MPPDTNGPTNELPSPPDTEPGDADDGQKEVLSVNLSLRIRKRHLKWIAVGASAIAFLVVMAVTNPTEDDAIQQIRTLVRENVKDKGVLERWLAPGATARHAKRNLRRTNCLFFSFFTITNPDKSEASFPGAFGRIWLLTFDDQHKKR